MASFQRVGAVWRRAGFHAAPDRASSPRHVRWLRQALGYAMAVVFVVGGIFAFRSSFSIYQVASASMEPTLHCAGSPHCRRLKDDLVVVSRLAYRVTRVRDGDIVAFTMPLGVPPACRGPGIRIKRVVGVPGEVVRPRLTTRGSRGVRPIRVPRDHYFLLSDNPRGSCDSRQVGTIPRQNLVGKVILASSPPWRLRRP